MTRLMAFIDGENLTACFERMQHAGHRPRDVHVQHEPPAIIHEPKRFVWSPATLRNIARDDELLRVHYYTTFGGSDHELEAYQEHLASQTVHRSNESGSVTSTVRLLPRVFHKANHGTGTKSVDINICVDVLEYVNRNALDSVLIVTGDVDYLPLLRSAMGAGKRVYLAALSHGLGKHLRFATDYFLPLDEIYFMS